MRTPDERPFRMRDLHEINRLFNVRHYYEQFLSVPAGFASRLLFRDPNNWLMNGAFALDRTLLRALPSIGLLFSGGIFDRATTLNQRYEEQCGGYRRRRRRILN